MGVKISVTTVTTVKPRVAALCIAGPPALAALAAYAQVQVRLHKRLGSTSVVGVTVGIASARDPWSRATARLCYKPRVGLENRFARQAQNESLFREVNERIAKLG